MMKRDAARAARPERLSNYFKYLGKAGARERFSGGLSADDPAPGPKLKDVLDKPCVAVVLSMELDYV
jgi:hypothetical protein